MQTKAECYVQDCLSKMEGVYVDEEQGPQGKYGSLMTSLLDQFSMGTKISTQKRS
jgi:hypothetical protein